MRVLVIGTLLLLLGAVGCTAPAKPVPPAATTAKMAAVTPPSGPRIDKVTVVDSFDGELSWQVPEGWGDPAEIEQVAGANGKTNRIMEVRFRIAENHKAVVSCPLGTYMDLSAYDALRLDLNSLLPVPCLVAVGFETLPEHQYVESAPQVVHPGWNKELTFRLDAKTFKSAAGGWRYGESAGDLKNVRRLLLLMYAIPDGRVQVDNLRLITFAPTRR
jgi:hypothetical protein